MKVAVMGAGAVGCYCGAMLAQAGHEVVLIGRPAHVEAVRRTGLRFERAEGTRAVPMKAETEPAAVEGAGLVLFCVKSTDTADAGRSMAPFLAPDAIVLSLQNGVDNAARLSEVISRHVAPAVVYVATEMAGPGHLRHHGRGDLVIGRSGDATTLATLFGEAGVPVELVDDVRVALWTKLTVNCAYNAISAITQQPYGWLMSQPSMPPVVRGLVDECVAVAAADGVTMPGDLWTAVERIAVSMPTQTSSTAQDLARRKPTEIDHLNGFVVRRGEALGVPTPLNRALWALVRALSDAGRVAA